MKTPFKTLLIACSATALLAAPVFADEGSDSSKRAQDSQLSTTHDMGKSISELRLSQLQGATAKSKDGKNLGAVEDVLFDQNGKITFLILGKGGFLGMGEKRVPVPWQALNVQSEKDYVINIDQEKWKSAPTLNKDQYTDLHNSDYVSRIYRFYTLEPATGMGAPGSDQGMEKGTNPKHDTPDYHK